MGDENVATSLDIVVFLVADGSSLGQSEVLSQLLLTIHFFVLESVGASHNLVKSAIISHAASIGCLLGPSCLVSVPEANIRLSQKSFIGAVLVHIDLSRDVFKALLGYVSDLERILRWHVVLDIRKEAFVIFGPELLSLLEQKS